MTPPPHGPRPTRPADPPYGARRRKRHARRAHSRRRRNLVLLALALALGAVAALVGVGFTGATAFSSSCNLSSLRPVSIGQNSFVYAADGSLLATIPAERNRQPVGLRQISPWMPKATVAIEDRRFYQHGGVDPQGIARAFVKDLSAGRVVEGGSTITQELVRNLYPISREQTITRKLKEACLAIKLSHARSKDWILDAYMNQVYYGNHAYGIEAAAKTYFSRHARTLTLAQAALLAGLPQAPTFYDPFRDPGAALARRNEVLRALLASGSITRARYAAASAAALGLKQGSIYTQIREPYFFSYVTDELVAQYGTNTVRTGGLRVYTTIDPRFQKLARSAIEKTLYLKTDPASAIVAINPANGAIRAMTAIDPHKTDNQFNFAAQARRQPGSTFKPIVLATAIEEGIDPETTEYLSAPFTYDPLGLHDCHNTEVWCVHTYEGTYYGASTIEQATLRSDNTVYAQLSLDVGPANTVAMAHRLGVRSPLQAVPSITLGSIGVSPLDMASAYATFAAGGIYSKPFAIRRVVLADGKVDTDAGWGDAQRRRVIPDWVAAEVTKILGENIRQGTAVAAYTGRPSAAKTGTTDNHADAWLCGYTPTLATAVWMGYPKAEIPIPSLHGQVVVGGTFPAAIWHAFMQPALAYTPPVDFPPPTEQPVYTSLSTLQYAIGAGNPATTSSSGYTSSTPAYTAPPTTTAPYVPPTTQAVTPASTPVTTASPVTPAPAPVTTTAPPATTAPAPPPTEPPPAPVTTAPVTTAPPPTATSPGPVTP